MYVNFDELPGNSRIWLFQSSSYLEMEKVEILSAGIINFLSDWQAHGKDLKASFQIFHNRFIAVILDEASYQATGCSIDKLTHLIQLLEKQLNITLLDRMQIAYREDEGMIVTLPLNAFRSELESGELDQNTIVFNNLIERKEQLQNQWEVPVRDSWHKQLLPIA